LQTAVSVERQLTKVATLNVTYLNSRGFDQLLTINANAPYPGTPCSPTCPTPTENLYRYVSEAVFRQNQLITNTNVRVGSKVQVFGYYVLNYANSDTSGVSSFPSNSYNISADYGRASFDIRNRLFFGGSFALPYNFRLSPFMIASSGSPFNITTTNDLNDDSIFNDRPGFDFHCDVSNDGKHAIFHHLLHAPRDLRRSAHRRRKNYSHQLWHWSIAVHAESPSDEDFRISVPRPVAPPAIRGPVVVQEEAVVVDAAVAVAARSPFRRRTGRNTQRLGSPLQSHFWRYCAQCSE
jgi:hypothetical protein